MMAGCGGGSEAGGDAGQAENVSENEANSTSVSAAGSGDMSEKTADATESDNAVASDASVYQEPYAFAASLGAGINIGNSLDCYDANCDGTWEVPETYWGNPEISDELIKKLADDGFKTLRLPVTWMHHVDADFNIQQSYMERVKHLVDVALDSGLYVIIDIHHDTWTYPSYDNRELALSRIEKIWSQVAGEFSDYDERLLFEGVNEPREKGQGNEWTDGSEMSLEVVNDFMQCFVDTVRNAGGKNAERYLLITDYCNTYRQTNLDAMRIPEDNRLLMSIHFYCPYNFIANRAGTFDDGNKQEFENNLATIINFGKNNNIPIVITEWGTFNSLDETAREEYVSYAVSRFKDEGIPYIWWDNGNTDRSDEAYGIYDRNTAECIYPALQQQLVQ